MFSKKVRSYIYTSNASLIFLQVERPEGSIVDIESRARKLKVLLNKDSFLKSSQVSLNSATTGVYKCYAGNDLVHSFHVTLEPSTRL